MATRQSKNLQSEIVKTFLSGELSLNAMALKYELSYGTIRRVLIKNGIALRNVKTGTSKLKYDVLTMWKNGKSSKTISKCLGTDRLRVARIIKNSESLTPRVKKMIISVIRSKKYPYNVARSLLDRSFKLVGKCEICSRKRNLVLDHDHSSDEIRGFICYRCNVALGVFEDSLQGLEKAQNYLIRYQKETPA